MTAPTRPLNSLPAKPSRKLKDKKSNAAKVDVLPPVENKKDLYKAKRQTPAEIRMIRTMGADLVGMSTVPEAIAAHALGAEVVGISLVTNAAAGMSGEKLSHDEVIAAGKASATKMGTRLAKLITAL